MKIAVYSICKNEEQFVDRFMNSAVGADKIIVCDTGSSDGTINRLKMWEVKFPHLVAIHSITVSPWRFDFARNVSLGLVPEDIDVCICLDLDEVLTSGWRGAIEAAWTPKTTRLRYTYVWSWDKPGIPGVVQLSDKIHSRQGYIWRHPCHEVARNYGIDEVQTFADPESFAVHHHPDNTKPRSQYLGLLEMGAKEDPWCDRNAYYLAREYFFNSRHEDAIREFERHRSLPSQVWEAERAASHRYQGKSLLILGRVEEARHQFQQATQYDPLHREGWNELAMSYYLLQDWSSCYRAAKAAIAIDRDHGTYIVNKVEAFGTKAHDLASIAAWRLALYDEAEQHCLAAISHDPDDQRLISNLSAIRDTRVP